MVGRIVTVACIGLTVAGCGILTPRPPPPPVPVIHEVTVDCTPDFPAWLFEPLSVPWMDEVRDAGGTNRALLQIFGLSRILLESANSRLSEIEDLYNAAKEECSED